MFSILHPGKQIPPHYGPFKGVLRYHLALETDKNNSEKCFIIINNKKYIWKAGEDLLFDDTYLHNVSNNTDTTRVVLFLDITREFKNPLINFLNKSILYFYSFNTTVQNVVKNSNIK